jgi:phenylpropionate dioxygenase-like ring-hydroxylating dioxygenase large terminal subunit
MKSSYPFSAVPQGWFRVAYSDELTPGKVIPLHYFDRNFVLFRTQDGQPQIFNAHCPHLGAHLGYGGKVTDKGIQCPFHGWCFNSHGQCVRIPYANKIPPQAQISTWYSPNRSLAQMVAIRWLGKLLALKAIATWFLIWRVSSCQG